MRFGGEDIKYGTIGSQFAAWKTECVKNGSFSEWSNVMLIKAITPPTANLVFNDMFNLLPTDLPGTPKIKLANSFPNFQVQLSLNQDKNNVENLSTSQFTLYRKKQEDEEYSLFEQSPTIEEVLDNNIIEYTFSQQLERDYTQENGNKNFYDYKIVYKGITVNGFQIFTEREFQMLPLSSNITISIDATPNSEIGAIDLIISLPEPGRALNCVLLRASEKTNYSQWEKILYFDFNAGEKYEVVHFRDWLIESGVKYKYRCYGLFQGQYIESIAGYFDSIYVNFNYNYLYCDGIQLPLKFNNKMSSFKHTILAAKTDTIGSQYPTIVRNGYVNYAEFPITGLISIAADEQETFIKWGEDNDGYYFNNQLIIPADKVNKTNNVRTETSASPNTTVPILLHNLTDDNIFIERKFREVVEQFLNNGKPKLFKSATEGNFIVSLINISLTPNQQLGRMISEFSSTAYEIAKCNLENCIKYKIHSIGENDMSIWEEDVNYTIGQWYGDPNGIKELTVEGVASSDVVNFLSSQRGIDLYNEIRKQVNTNFDISDPAIDYTFQSIEHIWIDNFPILTEEDVEVQKRKRDWAQYPYRDGWSGMTLKNYIEYAKKAKEYEIIYNNQNIETNEILDINGGINNWKHYIKLNKKYEILYLFDQSINPQLFASHPLVLNYIAKMSKLNLMDYSVQFGGYEIPVLGQLYGIFTEDPQTLYDINPYYTDVSNHSLVPNKMMEDTGATQLPNFYNTMDIMTLIKKDVKRYIKTIYQNGRMSLSINNPYRPKEGEVDNFLVDMNENLLSDSFEFYVNNQKYNFNYNVKLINWIEIEAQPGTKLKINGENIYIGPTGIYRLDNIDENTTITFDSVDNKQVEAIINYCLSTEQIIGVGE